MGKVSEQTIWFVVPERAAQEDLLVAYLRPCSTLEPPNQELMFVGTRGLGHAQLIALNRALCLLCQESKKEKGRRCQPSWGLLMSKAHEYVLVLACFLCSFG